MLLLAVGLALLLKAEGAQAADRILPPERRVALVIGNSNYVNFRPSLPNPRNDAEDVSAALRNAGFEVFLGLDLTKKGMEDLMQRFARAANGADAALTYYAGHGLQYQGRNYLVPVDARIEDEIDIEYQTTKVNDLVVGLSRAKGVRIIILDACRNLPLEEKASRSISVDTGLARISGRGLVVAYATQANALAYDGTGRNSLFTGAFLQAMNEPGLDLPQFFQRVSTTVDQNSDRRQTPELSLSYPGQFFFNRSETAADSWIQIRESTNLEDYREFIRKYPTHYLADAARGRLVLIEAEIRRKQDEDERERQREIATRRKQEEEERLRKEAEVERVQQRVLADLAIRRKQEEDVLRLKDVEADARRRRVEEERAEQERVRRLAEEDERKRRIEEEVNRRVAEMERQRREAEARDLRKPDVVERHFAMLPPGTAEPVPDGRDLGNARNASPNAQTTPADKPQPESAFPSETLKRDRLHRETEAELGRIGCFREGADTEWNDTSIAALGRYARQARLKPIPDEPTQDLLETLKRQSAHFCPIECGAGQRPSGDTCIAVTKPEQQPKPAQPAEQKIVVHKKPKPKPEPEDEPELKQAVRKKPEPKVVREKPELRHQAVRPPVREPREVERLRPRPTPAVAARPDPAPRPVAAPRPAPAAAPPQIPTSTASRPMRGPSMGFGF